MTNLATRSGLWLGIFSMLAGPASAAPECGDVIGPNEAVVLQSDIGPCTTADGECALTLGGNSFLVGNGHTLRCAPNPCIPMSDVPDGLCVRGSDSRVRDLRVRGCDRGVLVRGADHELTLIDSRRNDEGAQLDGRRTLVSDSVFNNNENDGLDVNGRSNVVEGTRLNNNGDDGAQVSGRNHELLDFTANGNDDDGLRLTNTENTRVLGGTARWNGEDGIDDSDTDSEADGNLIQYNDASRNGEHGIRVRSDASTIDGNAANDNGWSGISVGSTGQDNLITGNTALGNANPCAGDADLRDDNLDCDDNTWQGNTFDTRIVNGGSGDQTCID